MAIERKLELTFPAEKVTKPILSEMARKHPVVFWIDQANVSQRQGHFHFTLAGGDSDVDAAEAFLRERGVGVNALSSGPFQRVMPDWPKREAVSADEPIVSRKLWLTFVGDVRNAPTIWEMNSRFDVTFDVRQSSTSDRVEIMAILLAGPRGQVDGAMAFLESKGVEVEPIEKSVVEG